MRSSVNANAVLCVKGEIHNVLTVLRLNARWASKARFTTEIPLQAESPLTRALKGLHSYLEVVDDLRDVDTVRYLEPFLAVVQSPHTTGPMTGAALSSLHKFLLYGFITVESPRAKEGIEMIASAVSRCHFEETDPDSDEVVLMKLLELLALCLRCEVGCLMSETHCFEIFQTCYKISCQERVSSLLGNTAGNTLANIVLMVFSRARLAPRTRQRDRASPSRQDSAASTAANAGSVGPPSGPLSGAPQEAAEEEHEDDVEPWPSVDGGSDGEAQAAESGQATQGRQGLDKGHRGHRRGLPRGRGGGAKTAAAGSPVAPQEEPSALVEIMRHLSKLSNPRENPESSCVLALSLINIALEAGGGNLGHQQALVQLMQGDLCKHLLQNSQTEDLTILSLTLRVVFNLFSSIKDHLKVQLEVFLTSVHLRILEGGGGHSPEQRELALESLLEFCREPALMLDLYINYDCDVQCTNLFETICNALSKQALPSLRHESELNTLNRLALEGVLAVIESIARRCRVAPPSQPLPTTLLLSSTGPPLTPQTPGPRLPSLSALPAAPPSAGLRRKPSSLDGDDPLTPRDYASSESDSELEATMLGAGVDARETSGLSAGPHGELSWLVEARARTAEVLQQRKKMKRRLTLAAERFNKDEKDKAWLGYAQELGLLPTPPTAADVARFLKTTLGLDKTKLGEYLSKGPPDKYPFNAQVLQQYVRLFDFKSASFDGALRLFLKEFRLPGEAQCIDRLMEAFAKEMFSQGREHLPFVDADAAFVLAFSVIMLNTDLHNPVIQEHRRMTLEQFINNNRGINGGKNLPEEFLRGIYDTIRSKEIQVHRDHMSIEDGLGIDYHTHWDGILNRSQNVASASFTPSTAARKHTFPAGVHERDMFTSIAEMALTAIAAVFERSRDDILVLKALHGFQSYAKICVYFDMAPSMNGLLVLLFRYGHGYILGAAEGYYSGPFPAILSTQGLPNVGDLASCTAAAAGSAVHRGLLALKCGLELVRAHGKSVAGAWQHMMECVFALADLNSLPASLSDLDDFGDAKGSTLPRSVFATRCRANSAAAQQSIIAKAGRNASAEKRGSLWGLSSLLWASDEGPARGGAERNAAVEAAVAAMQQVVLTCQLDQLFPRSKDLSPGALRELMQALLACRNPAAVGAGGPRDSISGPSGSPPAWAGGSFEAHAVLALELAARVALANSHRMAALWGLMHAHLARILGSQGSMFLSRMPFLVERAMVTVLRGCIHMMDREDLSTQLLESLDLLKGLPLDIVTPLANRLASGLLILIQANGTYLNTVRHWEVTMTLLHNAVVVPAGRTFVWEAVHYLADRGVLSRDNVQPVYALLVRFVEGDFEPLQQGGVRSSKRDFLWTAQALVSLEHFVLKLTTTGEAATTGVHQRGTSGGAPGPGADPNPETCPPNSGGLPGQAPADPRALSGGQPGAPEPPSPAFGGFGPVLLGGGLTCRERETLWLSSLRTIKPFLGHPWTQVAKVAADCLQRLVLQSSVVSPEVWSDAFSEVLLKLPVAMQKPGQGVPGSDNEEVCLRCSSLLSRSFLHNIQILLQLDNFDMLWLTTLGLLGSNLKQSPSGGIMHETIQQMITNMIMVMAHAGVLSQPLKANSVEAHHSDLLELTRRIVDPMCPNIRPLLDTLSARRQGAPRASDSAAAVPAQAATHDRQTV